MRETRSRASILFMAGALLTLTTKARAATYYVANSGSDSSSGAIGTPFRTIAHGISVLAAGDTLYLRAGTYPETLLGPFPSGTSSAPITVAAYPGETATIAPTSSVGDMWKIATASYITIDGLIMDGTNVTQAIIFLGAGDATSAHYIVVKNSTLKNSQGQGVLLTSMADHNSFINDKIFKNGATNPRIHGLYIEGSYNLVDHCDIYGNSGLGVNVYNGYAGASANYNVVSNNTVHDNSSASTGSRQGIGLSSGAGNTAFNNILWNNGSGIVVGTNDGTTPATNARVYNNTIYNNNVGAGRYGIYLTSNGSGAVVQNNIAFDNLDGNIVNGGQSVATIASNVTVDPLFVNAAGLNFQLLAGSPAIDKGVNLSAQGVTVDIAGTARPQGAAYDIGAYEYGGGTTTTPPALSISGVTATGITATGATIGWTTNVNADGQVVYGPTTSYGSSTPLNSTLATSHSFALTGLTGATLYHYAVKSHDASGNLVTSPDGTFTTSVPSAPAGCASSSGVWQNLPVTAQTGTFTAQFDVTPGAAAIDGASGVSNGAATAWTSLAASVRFNNTGMIDARNGGAYAAATAVPYVAGMTYHVRLVVNIPAHSYSAYVKQGSNAEQLVGSNYAFRTEQASVTTLNNVGVYTDAGTITTCSASATAVTATTITGVSASGIGQTSAAIGWTTNNPADSQVKYGLTSAYGITSTLSSTLVTSHSVSLGGLTAGTVYHYSAMSHDSTGALVSSPDATFTTLAPTVTAPVISGVSASAITASAATINWTTDVPATSQVVYGPASSNVTVIAAGSVYTLSSALNSTLSTSHSVPLSGLTASTLYHYAVKSANGSGALTTSPDATFTTAAAGTSGGTTGGTGSTSGGTLTACMTSAGTWQNAAVPSLTGTFTAEFDGSASAVTTDGVGGLSNGPATTFTSLAVAVRFNNTGKIDARNGGAYAAAASIPYAANATYHFRLVINLTAHTYSAYVKQGANAEVLIGSNYAFRTEQKAVTALNNLAGYADAGSVKICNGTTHL
ncbi:MAG TPA: fibronectin type III domain-containing protein [Elusimicrobiota bacterium]|nr:fibronectin type III domain-containing protein [Elusimicrobiota bacterium]